MAWLLPLRRARALWRVGAHPRRSRVWRAVPTAGDRASVGDRAPRLGWRMVPPRLLRRRYAARIPLEPGVHDRFDFAKLVGAFRGRPARPKLSGNERRRRAAGTPSGRARTAPEAAFRRRVEPRLY